MQISKTILGLKQLSVWIRKFHNDLRQDASAGVIYLGGIHEWSGNIAGSNTHTDSNEPGYSVLKVQNRQRSKPGSTKETRLGK